MVALKHFPNINKEEALGRPILFSNWLSKDYIPVDREELREYVKARLKVRKRKFRGLERQYHMNRVHIKLEKVMQFTILLS